MTSLFFCFSDRPKIPTRRVGLGFGCPPTRKELPIVHRRIRRSTTHSHGVLETNEALVLTFNSTRIDENKYNSVLRSLSRRRSCEEMHLHSKTFFGIFQNLTDNTLNGENWRKLSEGEY